MAVRPVNVNPHVICAALAWHDEDPEVLYRATSSLAGCATVLVALPGPWWPWEGEAEHSHAQQQYAIADGATAAGMGYYIGTAQPWPSQQAKRSALMAMAAATGASWLFVIDADEWVAACDQPALYAALAATDRDVATLELRVLPHGARGYSGGIRRLYRASTAVRVHGAHNGYRTADGRWLHGDSAHVPVERPADCTAHLALCHAYRQRSPQRNAADIAYRSERRAAGQEAWA